MVRTAGPTTRRYVQQAGTRATGRALPTATAVLTMRNAERGASAAIGPRTVPTPTAARTIRQPAVTVESAIVRLPTTRVEIGVIRHRITIAALRSPALAAAAVRSPTTRLPPAVTAAEAAAGRVAAPRGVPVEAARTAAVAAHTEAALPTVVTRVVQKAAFAQSLEPAQSWRARWLFRIRVLAKRPCVATPTANSGYIG